MKHLCTVLVVLVLALCSASSGWAGDLNKLELRGTPVEIVNTLGGFPIFGVLQSKVLVYDNAPVQGGSELLWVTCSAALANWCSYAPNLLNCPGRFVFQGPDPSNPDQVLETWVCPADHPAGSCQRMTGFTAPAGPVVTSFFSDTTCSVLP